MDGCSAPSTRITVRVLDPKEMQHNLAVCPDDNWDKPDAIKTFLTELVAVFGLEISFHGMSNNLSVKLNLLYSNKTYCTK